MRSVLESIQGSMLRSIHSQWWLIFLLFHFILFCFFQSSWSNSNKCWMSTGPLYFTIQALLSWTPIEWNTNRVVFLKSLIHLAIGRFKESTHKNKINYSSILSSSLRDDRLFAIVKPYLIYFALVDLVYKYLFNVSLFDFKN